MSRTAVPGTTLAETCASRVCALGAGRVVGACALFFFVVDVGGGANFLAARVATGADCTISRSVAMLVGRSEVLDD